MSDNENIAKPLKIWLEEFYEHTGKVSDIVRNLGLASIAIIWVFKNSSLAQNIIPKELILPLFLSISGLVVEFLQYLWSAVAAYFVYRINEYKYDKGKLTEEQISDVKAPVIIEIVTWIFFIGKIVFIGLAYIKIYQFIIIRL